MIVTKNNLRFLVGVLVIYCCIDTTVGESIRGVLNEDEPTPDTTISGPTQTDANESSDTTMSDATVSQSDKTRPKIHRRTSMMPHKKTTTTEIPLSTTSEQRAQRRTILTKIAARHL